MIKSSILLLTLGTAVTARNCRNITTNIPLVSRNGIYDVQPLTTDVEVTDFFLNISRHNFNYSKQILKGYKSIRENYNVSFSYCQPDKGPGDTVQILTHGIGFDRHYWDLPLNDYNNSYVNYALKKGYSVLFWDRLGIGSSSRGDPIGEIQLPLDVSALEVLNFLIKMGKLEGVDHKFAKVVNVGHSFGSAVVFAMVNHNRKLADAIILTGYTQADFLAYFALGGNFGLVTDMKKLSAEYGPGYLAPKLRSGVQINFLAPNDYDPLVLDYAYENMHPASIGQLLTIGSVPKKNKYKGPIYLISGERDVPFCGGNCKSMTEGSVYPENLLENSKRFFRKSRRFRYTVIRKAGHALNYHFSVAHTCEMIFDFLRSSI